jgi:hypothetical protein
VSLVERDVAATVLGDHALGVALARVLRNKSRREERPVKLSVLMPVRTVPATSVERVSVRPDYFAARVISP